MVETKTLYITEDGKEFDLLPDAEAHENSYRNKVQERISNYTNLSNWNYNHLMDKHTLDEHGVWEIRGEDANADLGGHHYQAYLATVDGKLSDVINYACSLNGFFSYGGGSIKKIQITTINS